MYIYAIASYFLHPCTPKLPLNKPWGSTTCFCVISGIIFDVEFYAVGFNYKFSCYFRHYSKLNFIGSNLHGLINSLNFKNLKVI